MADFYIYAADIYCADCGEEIAERIRREHPDAAEAAERGEADSDTFPDGPYPGDHSGESDSPEHCGACGEYLATPLTSHGVAYAVDALAEYIRTGRGSAAVLDTWAAHLHWYGLEGMPRAILGAFLRLRRADLAEAIGRLEESEARRIARFSETRERWRRKRAA